jgi:hypothetical protein
VSTELNAALLAVFAVHLAAFGRLAWLRRERYYAVASLTFVLLVGVFALRLWAPEWELGGHPASRYLRVAAWGSAAVSLSLFVRRRARRKAARAVEPAIVQPESGSNAGVDSTPKRRPAHR